MVDLSSIAKLLGEENEKRLKDAITDILINTIEEDLNQMNTFLIDFEGLFDEVRRETEKELKDIMCEKYMAKIESKMDEFLGVQRSLV